VEVPEIGKGEHHDYEVEDDIWNLDAEEVV